MSTRYWADQTMGNYSQENNASEKLVGHLESCGPTAVACLLEDLGVEQISIPWIQIEDYYTMVLNSPKLIDSPDGYPANRYVLNYPKLLKLLYPDLKTKMIWFPKPYDPAAVAQRIKLSLAKPNTGLLLVMDDPGHYIAAQHFEAGILYYADPWVGNKYNPAPTVKRSIRLTELAKNLKIGFMEVSK